MSNLAVVDNNTTNDNDGLFHSGFSDNESSDLDFVEPSQIPLDGGASELKNIETDQIILATGEIRTLSGSDEDLLHLTHDRSIRIKATILQAYILGMNLERAKQYFATHYPDGEKLFWSRMTKLTGFNQKKLEDEILLSKRFTREDIELLLEQGISTSLALKFARKRAAKDELLEEAKETKRLGGKISPQIAQEILDEFTPKAPRNNNGNGKTSSGESKTSAPPQTKISSPAPTTSKEEEYKEYEVETDDEDVDVDAEAEADAEANDEDVDADADVDSEPIVTTFVFDEKISSKTLNNNEAQKLEKLLESANSFRFKYLITTVRGEISRANAAAIYAAYYEIPLPNAEPSIDEEAWISELRDYLPKGCQREISPIFFTAYIEGHLAYFQGETTPPEDYALLGPNPNRGGGGGKLRAEGLVALYKFWEVGYEAASRSKK